MPGSARTSIAFAHFRSGIYAGIGLACTLLRAALERRGNVILHGFAVGRRDESHSLLRKSLLQIADLASFIRLVLRERISLVHLNTVLAPGALPRDYFIALICRLLEIRLLIEFHGSRKDLLESAGCLNAHVRGLILDTADIVAVLSEEERHAFSRLIPYASKVRVVKNPLPPPGNGRDQNVKHELGISNENPVLLFISRLDESKGILDTITAMDILRHRLPDARLVVAGDGDCRKRAHDLVCRLGLDENVHFLGWVPETETGRLYAESDVLVFPTYFPQEGFPMVILQALGAGLPIVTTRYRAMADHLRDPDHCLFVEPRQPGQIAEAVQRILGDKSLRNSMRENNTKLAEEFSPETVAAEFEKLYGEILRRDVTPAP